MGVNGTADAEAAGLRYSSDEEPGICRASYVHPQILEAFAAGDLPSAATRRLKGLDRWESTLLRFLRASS